uniref:Uncharacterized protein n=1 Tax=Opuntia streptacantha TaxID=393608 RepID=A0A7C9ENE0_OPUST
MLPRPTIPTRFPPNLEPRQNFPRSGHDPARTNRSEAEILRSTSMSNPTAQSAASSEKASPRLATAIPRRRHSERSIWSVPTLWVTTSSREGRQSRVSFPRGEGPTQRTARASAAWERRTAAGLESASGSRREKVGVRR